MRHLFISPLIHSISARWTRGHSSRSRGPGIACPTPSLCTAAAKGAIIAIIEPLRLRLQQTSLYITSYNTAVYCMFSAAVIAFIFLQFSIFSKSSVIFSTAFRIISKSHPPLAQVGVAGREGQSGGRGIRNSPAAVIPPPPRPLNSRILVYRLRRH